LVLGIAAGVALRKAPTLYESPVRIVATSAETGDASDLPNRLNGLRQQTTNRDTLEAVLSKCELLGEPLEAVVSRMRGRIVVEADTSRDSQPAFTISYRARDPETARKIANETCRQGSRSKLATGGAPTLRAGEPAQASN
jgi:hypothetical protein